MPVRFGETHPAAKLNSEQVLIIRKLWKQGFRNLSVTARHYGVSPSNILKIVRENSWKHLNPFWN